MARWAPDAALRLEQAALDLFDAQGYAATTVPQIAARAGLTTRTFFRHFADKREVLFLRDREFPRVLADLLQRAPAGLTPLDLVLWGAGATAPELEGWRDAIVRRRAVIRGDDRLRERELLKSATLAQAMEAVLTADGVDPRDAALAARIGTAVFDRALEEWLDGDEPSFSAVLQDRRAAAAGLLAALERA